MAEDMKHTPGPWIARRNSSYWQVDAEAFGQIGDACASSANPELGGSESLGRANAMLMAAAPSFYEAADEVDVFASNSPLEGADERVVPVCMTLGTIRKFRAAILKANGSPQAAQPEGK